MLPVTRLYDSEAAVHHAIDKLVEAELPRDCILVISPQDHDGEQAVDDAIAAGRLRSGHRRALKEALGRGRWVVSATPEVLLSGLAQDLLDEAGPVDSDTIPSYVSSDPAPFSEALGIPVLTDGKSNTELFKFDLDSSFGFKLLSDNPAPLSSLFGLPLLKSSRGSIARGSSVERMSGSPAPFSSRLGLKLLSGGSGSKARGSSVEKMSGNPAPFSRLLGLPVLSKKR